jgi:DNA-binding NtrC family response regulator
MVRGAVHEFQRRNGHPLLQSIRKSNVRTTPTARTPASWAAQDKVGLFEYASSGTVFPGEIGDLPLTPQTKLLRVLETREFPRGGSPAPRKANVRVIAATNRDLREMAEQELFRTDLFYRLSMIEIHLPR